MAKPTATAAREEFSQGFNAGFFDAASVVSGPDHRSTYKVAVDEANAFKCTECKHRGPIEPYPPFNEKESDEEAFKIIKDPKAVLGEEFLCFHTRDLLPE